MKPTVLVTEKEFLKGREVFEACPDLTCLPAACDESTLARRIQDHKARAAIVGVDPYAGPLYEALAGGLIARFGVGCDGIDRNRCERHNVVLKNTPGVLDVSVAEHTVWLMGALARKIVWADRALRAGTFRSDSGEELAGKTLLLIGFGQIARRVARIAGIGIGMRVLAFDRLTLARQAELSHIAEETFLAHHGLADYGNDLNSLLARADLVSLHLSATPETRHFVDDRWLSECKKGALLINTSRGPIVDENALFDALASRQLSAAALDVFEHEPYQPVDPKKDLRTLQTVILTPHIGSNTHQANLRMAEMTLHHCRDFLQSGNVVLRSASS